MVGMRRYSGIAVALAFVAVAAALVVGWQLRMRDPSSSEVLPAEDPFMHMALVREHVRDGHLDPLNPGARLYPPGMHAYLAAAWVYTGTDLYEVVRLAPVFMGLLGIVGVGLLLTRTDGPVAGFVGAMAFAVAPEVILRTTMAAPTALDLALLPFFFYAIFETLRGRLGWAGVAGAIALFLVFSHPWILSIIGLAGVVFAIATLALPWPRSRGPPVAALGLAAAVAVIGVTWGLSVSSCWGWCGPSFQDVYPGGGRLALIAPFLAAASLLLATLIVYSRRGLDRFFERPVPERAPPVSRAVMSAALAIFLVAVTYPAVQQGLPRFVFLDSMFGWPILALAILGFVALPFLPSPAAHLGAAIAAVTYPFVIYNPFHSEFWPHRTAVYLGLGLVLLAGVAAGALTRWIVETIAAVRANAPTPPRWTARPVLVLAPLVAAVLLGGAVYAATPEDNPSWYRLYEPCQFDTLQQAATRASADPDLVVVTGDWQAKLVLAALTTNASRVWYKGDFYTDPNQRADVLKWHAALAVVDPHLMPSLRNQTPDADTSFLHSSPWQEVGRSCADPDTGEPAVLVYAAPRGASG
jgi:hypothetical protein